MGGRMPNNDPNVYHIWFRGLFDRMAVLHPELIRADTALWPKEEPYFFDRFRLYAWSYDTLFSGCEVGDGLLSLSDKSFWDLSHRRELLHLLRQRWPNLPLEKRSKLEHRLAQGPAKWQDETDEEHVRRCSLVAATIFGWLIDQGCNLSEDILSVLPKLREANPYWQTDLDKNADQPYGVAEDGWPTIERDPSALLDVPVSEVIFLAQENTTSAHEDLTDYRPFDGLVKENLDRAVATLKAAEMQGEYPQELWHSLLENWPDTANHRLIGLVGETLTDLPSDVIENYRYHIFPWLKKNLPKLAAKDQTRTFRIFDVLIDRLFDGGANATRSGIGEVRVAGDSQGWSRKTMNHAFNSAVGLAAQLLFDLLDSRNLEKGSGVPSAIKSRLERLIGAPGEGADHAVCLVAHQVEWLHNLDPNWARSTIVPWFYPGHQNSEPAWNGLLYRSKPPLPELFSLIRTYFLQVFNHAHNWKWNDQGLLVLHEFLVIGCLWHKHDEVYLTYSEVHGALQQTDDSGRSHTISYLSNLIERNHTSWREFGKRFVEEAWPRETSYKTEDTSLNLARLAGFTGEDFPEAVQTILPLLVKIERDGWFLLRVVSRGGNNEFELPTRFPEPTLALVNRLVPDDPPEQLFDLNLNLEKIAEAKPSLRQDIRWRRLKGIARRG